MTATEGRTVSVVIPTYNRAELVVLAIASVLGQSHPPDEVIVVDDCSTDDAPSVLQAFGDEIRVVRTERNIERGAARNLGAREGRGDLLAFLDADDEWEPEKLERQLAHVGTSGACVTGATFVDAGGRPLHRYAPPRHAADRILLENPYLAGPSSVVLSRHTFNEVGGFPEERQLQGSEDWIFFAKLVGQGHVVGIVPQPLVRYRVHETNSTASPENRARSMWAAVLWMEAEGLLTQKSARRLRGRTAGVIGRGFAANRRWRQARSWAATAVGSGNPFESARSITMIALSATRAVIPRRP